ncbi:MAG TPA: ATP-binding protein [Steroidobacteraceae bacterium]|nr:ATP-binding protein [Steroidobacteraceae bacterium]
MDAHALKRAALRLLAAVALCAGLAALALLALSVENSATFTRWQPWILLFSICGVLALGVLLTRKLWQLYRDFRNHVPGSRLAMRTVWIFGSLVIAPLVIVYLFSLDFINRGIDSWFRVEIKQGLNDAVVLSRAALDLRLREQARRTDSLAHALRTLSGTALLSRLEDERRATEAQDIIVYDAENRPIAVSSAASTPEQPGPPVPEVILQLATGRPYVSLNPLANGRYTITTAAPIGVGPGSAPDADADPAAGPAVAHGPTSYVLINYMVPLELSALAEAVQHTSSQYGDLSAVREPLKISFRLTLTLVVLLTLLAAIYGAIFSAQRLTRPVQDLIAGTRAVGKGDFGTRLPLPSRDEMGFLVHSFNDMTKRLRRTSEEAARSRQAVERERERLSIILSRLSTGVIVTDHELVLHSANQSASSILASRLESGLGQPLATLAAGHPRLSAFVAELGQRLSAGVLEWREQLGLPGESGQRVLLWAGTPLPDERERGLVVIVFDDITALLAAQREAAWGEVARRLAHEIKNPLTPIQLSAERLRRKLLPAMNAEDSLLLERATHTIVQQVDAMKQMVNAFSEYARAPDMQLARFNLNQLVSEVAELYRLQDPSAEIRLALDARLPEIEADRGRVRQILANLITNGIEALAGRPHGSVEIGTQLQDAQLQEVELQETPGPALAAPASARGVVQICVRDNGPGFRKEILGRLFDPYVTSKPRGTGLGLAIVKRIVEEHGGRIEAENRPEGGARVRVWLPLSAEDRALLAGVERRMELRRERA